MSSTQPSVHEARSLKHVLQEEDSLLFDGFDFSDAWELGVRIRSTALERRLPVAIAIDFGEQRIFHAALPGTSADNDEWIARKLRVVRRHNRSSLGVGCEYRVEGVDYYSETGADRSAFTVSGGAVPLRVRGLLVGAVAVSGLTEEEDHDLVIDVMRSFAAERAQQTEEAAR